MENTEVTKTARGRVSFQDGLGDRIAIVESTSGDTLEALRLAPTLAANSGVERALRERVSRLIEFRHANYARIWRVEGEAGSPAGLSLVSERPRGMRVAELLQGIAEGRYAYDVKVAQSLIEQLVSAIASLHLVGRDVAHGTLGPERLVVTPHAQLVIVEHVLAPALEHLNLNRTRLWQDFRVAVPAAAGMSRLDQRSDLLQIGMVTLALLLGRLLRDEEFPGKLADLVDEACQPAADGLRPPLSRSFGAWLVRVLQLDLRHSFQSAIEAKSSLEEALQDDAQPGAVRLVAAPAHAAPDVAPGAALASRAAALHHQAHVRRENSAHFGGLDRGAFGARREPLLKRAGRAVVHVLVRAAAVLVAVTAALGLAYVVIHHYAPTWLPDHQATVLSFGSQYAGAEVVVDGKSHGRAPTEIAIKPGPHTIELRPAPKPKTPQTPTAPSRGAQARPAASK